MPSKRFQLFLISSATVVMSLFGAWGLRVAMAGPSQNPPLGNADAPINTGAGRQTKTGDLGVNNLNSSGVSSATQFCLPGSAPTGGCIAAWNDRGFVLPINPTPVPTTQGSMWLCTTTGC